jgi:sortase A
LTDDLRIWLSRVLFAGGLILIGFVALNYARSCTREWEARNLSGEAPPRDLVKRASASRARAESTGDIGHLEIERLGLRAAIVEGIDSKSLVEGVGHVPGTAFPGEPDNSALAGHRDTHLAKLRKVEPGDRIRIQTADGVFLYEVDSAFVVRPNRGDLMGPTGRGTLTLITCYPFRWIGPAPKRFIVRASPVAARGASSGTRASSATPPSPP